MPQISLTDLVDIVSKAGTPKATKVRQIKYRTGYSPATDFYRLLRNGITDIHKADQSKSALPALMSRIHDPKKLSRYQAAITGYAKWWANKDVDWFEPARGKYEFSEVEVSVNPELGLEINGTRHLIKLYFKDDPLEKLRVDVVTVLMATTLKEQLEEGTLMSILDVNRGKLFNLAVSPGPMQAIVNAELAYVAALWPSI